MPNFHFGDDLDPEFIPKLIPRGPTWDELGIFLIYGSNWTKFRLSGPFWQTIRLSTATPQPTINVSITSQGLQMRYCIKFYLKEYKKYLFDFQNLINKRHRHFCDSHLSLLVILISLEIKFDTIPHLKALNSGLGHSCMSNGCQHFYTTICSLEKYT